MFKFKDFCFSAVIVAYAAIFNLFGVENLFFHDVTEASESSDVLRNEVLKLVELEEFSKVDRMLSGMQRNSTEFEMIVEEILKKTNQSDILFEYARKTSVPELNCLILKNLWIEKSSRNDTNLFQTMDIYKALHPKVIQNKNLENGSMKSLACKIFEEEIRSEIQNKSISSLKSLFLAKDFDEFRCRDFLDHLARTSEEILEYVNKMVIDQTWSKPDLYYWTIVGTNYPFSWKVFTTLHLLSKKETISKANGFDYWIPASLIEEKRQYLKENNLTDFMEKKFTELLDYFSSDVKILLLSENVCFRNYISKEYICRSSIENKTEDHNVELCTERSLKNFWKIVLLRHLRFQIQDSNNSEHRLYISGTHTDSVHVGNSSGYDKWQFVKKDNSFSILKFGTPNYLCLSDNKLKISLEKDGSDYDKCHWLVEKCDFL